MIARFIISAVGATAGVFLAYLIGLGIGWAWGPLYASEEDMARNVKIFLVGTVMAALACGWIANRWYTRNLTRRSNGRS